jgi:group II intron reverse transcriptase/maturase
MAVKLVIEPLFEADFCDCSYGFRPKRSNTQAAQLVHKLVNRLKWVVDVDLAGYFDTIPHEALMRLVRRRVRDRRVLHLIRGWLTAGTMDSGELVYGVRGTPQGGVLSPLLSNIYLHELDRQWDSADGQLVRFADDFVILCRTEAEAHAALAQVRARVAALDLAVNEDKTRVGHVRAGFDFLGFTYREAYSERQRRLVRIKTPRAKSQKKVRRHLKERLQQVPLGQPLSEAVTSANRTLRGWATYFRIGNSYAAGLSLTHYACAQVRLWLRRKKHRKDRRCLRKWPDGFFYSRGLCYVPDLLRS